MYEHMYVRKCVVPTYVHTYVCLVNVHKYVHKTFEHSKSYIVLCAKITAVNGETLQNHVCDHSKFCITLYTIILPSQIDLSTQQQLTGPPYPYCMGIHTICVHCTSHVELSLTHTNTHHYDGAERLCLLQS